MATSRLKSLVATTLAIFLAGSCICVPSLEAKETKAQTPAAKTEPQGIGSLSLFDETQSKAFVLVMDEKYEDAKKLITNAIKQEKRSPKVTNLYYLLSAIEYMDEDYDKAIAHLQLVLNAQPVPKTPDERLNHALILKRIGDCYYGERNTQPALNNYRASLLEWTVLGADHLLSASLLEAITGTLVYAKKYAEAEESGKKFLDLATDHAKSNSIEDVAVLFWAKIQMLGILRHLGKMDERSKLWAASMPMLDKVLMMRAQLEQADQLPELESTKKDFEERYISKYHPSTPAEYLWLASEFKMRTLPLIQWPARTEKAKASILCIHGLGLENRAFTSFGREMGERGYSVYALDVRGFGSWQTTQGQEDVQFSETLKDIGSVIHLIKQRENGLPIFLLGESMGGAIALRGAAEYGNAIAGVISSVPSAERFQEKRMSLSVAYHLLQGINRPYHVGDMVTSQATNNADISKKWKTDVKAKMDMSPKELIKFAVFMRTTKGECEKINVPVFVVQGLADKLVKPEGTFQLFAAVKGDDKDLLILGTAEHLIFETFKPRRILMDSLCTWIDEHRQTGKSDIDNAKNDTDTSKNDTDKQQ